MKRCLRIWVYARDTQRIDRDALVSERSRGPWRQLHTPLCRALLGAGVVLPCWVPSWMPPFRGIHSDGSSALRSTVRSGLTSFLRATLACRSAPFQRTVLVLFRLTGGRDPADRSRKAFTIHGPERSAHRGPTRGTRIRRDYAARVNTEPRFSNMETRSPSRCAELRRSVIWSANRSPPIPHLWPR